MSKFKSLLIAVLTFTAVPWMSASTLQKEAEAVQRLEVDVDHEPFSSLWVEIYDSQDHLLAAWYLPWDEAMEWVSGLKPTWVERGIVDGWTSFAVSFPHPDRYRVVVVSLDELWALRLFPQLAE